MIAMGSRFSISGLMALVMIVALDFGLARSLLNATDRDFADLVIYGALPMANLLAIGCIALFWLRPDQGGGRRPDLVGFQAFGVAALLVFLGSALLATHAIHEGVGTLLRGLGLHPGPLFLAGAVATLMLPQLALACLGGWLGGRYKIRVRVLVERRVPSRSSPGPTTGPLMAGGV